MKIAIFGGSFDPVHIGHIKIIKEAIKSLDIDLLFVVPAFLNPFKKSFFATPKLRLKWLKKALMQFKKVKICDFEIKKNRPTYTIDTIKHLKKRYRPSKIYLIIGADNLDTLSKWHNFKKLKNMVEFVIANRDRVRSKKYKRLNIDIKISSTKLRKKPIKRFLPKIVANDIVRFYRD